MSQAEQPSNRQPKRLPRADANSLWHPTRDLALPLEYRLGRITQLGENIAEELSYTGNKAEPANMEVIAPDLVGDPPPYFSWHAYAKGWFTTYGKPEMPDAWLTVVGQAGHILYIRPPHSLSLPLPRQLIMESKNFLDARDGLSALHRFEPQVAEQEKIIRRLAGSLEFFADKCKLQLPQL